MKSLVQHKIRSVKSDLNSYTKILLFFLSGYAVFLPDASNFYLKNGEQLCAFKIGTGLIIWKITTLPGSCFMN